MEKLIFHIFSVSYFEIYWPLSGRSQTTLTRFCPFLTTYLSTPCWHLWMNCFIVIGENLHTVDISSTTYKPCFVNVFWDRPHYWYVGEIGQLIWLGAQILEDSRLSSQQSFQQNCLVIIWILATIFIVTYIWPRILNSYICPILMKESIWGRKHCTWQFYIALLVFW